jgi:hypothetical protein
MRRGRQNETWGRVEESLIRANGVSQSASGVGLAQLCHREYFLVRQSGRKEEGRREAPRQALQSVPRLRVEGPLIRALGNPNRLKGALSLRRRRSARRHCYDREEN